MPREDAVRVRHMLDAASEAAALAKGKQRGDIETDRLLGLALVRLLEVLGEAAGRASDETRSRHPAIPWSRIVGLRNRLIYGYDSVDMEVLWAIITKDLPPLIAAVEKLLPPK